MKKRSFIRRVIAMLAVCAMTVTYLPAYVSAEETVDPTLVLHYDFESLKSGTIVNDVSGNGKAGVVRPTGSEVKTQTDLILGEEYTSFVMNGGQPDATHTYVELPQGVLNDLEDVTISCWVYVNTEDSGYSRVWDIGSGTTSYMYLLVDGGNDGHKGYTGAITSNSWGAEKGPEKGTNLDTGRWIFTTLTFDGSEKSMSIYEDGQLIGTEKTDDDLSVLKDSTQNYIGYGQWGNDILDGRIADFKIYNYAMTAEEVKAQVTIDDKEKVARDEATLTLGDVSAVTEDLTLPAKGSAGSDVAWTSSNTAVIANDGKVTRPTADKEDVKVTLTATITAGAEKATKTFEVTVKRQMNAKEVAESDAAAIDLGNLSSVTKNLTLPTKGESGSEISWASDNEAVISNTGVVKRPEGSAVNVKLTATVTFTGETVTREFTATVAANYTKIKIKEVKDVAVVSYVGKIPSLPSTVDVVYDNDTTGKEKVAWPTDLKTSDFAAVGIKTVKGTIVDTDIEVTANVTVTDEAEVAPAQTASSFDLSDISLDGNDTIYSQNANRAYEYLKIMDADRMLYNFRKTFGQDTKGAKALTGWDEPTGLLRGHSTGHFISALSIAYASTGDTEYKEKLDYMIAEMRKLQELSKGDPAAFETACTPTDASQSKWSTDPTTWGEGFISAYSPDQFALLEQYTPYATIWAPYYTLHKLMAGFIDSYTYAGNEEGLEIAKDLGTWIYKRLDGCTTATQRSKMWAMYIAGEYGGMNESLARLYEITKDDTYLKAAQMFDNTDFFDGLANNVDTIQGRHANQHIPQIVGAVHEYAATGDVKYYDIAQNFWEMVVSRYAYSIGGVGTGERFKDPYQQGNNILGNSGRGENCETCAAYNMLKLTMDLYNYNPDDASYMDYYERTLLNQIAASQSHDTTAYMHNGCTYMLPVDPGQKKDYDSDYGGFTCCNGTGMENHVKYQAAAYAHTDDTLYVNLYMPTTVTWDEMGVSVKQETKFPSEHSKLTVSGNGTFAMKLRVPYWATDGFTVKVNDEVIVEKPAVSTYVEITRTWKDGDVVTIDMPYTLHLDKTPDKVDESTVASLMYGPIVMVAKDQNDSYKAMNWYNIALSDKLSECVDIIVGTDEDAVPQLSTNGLQFYPMYDAYNYRYHAYVKVDEAGAAIDKTKLQALVDSVTGENAPAKEDYSPKSYRTLLEKIQAAQAELDAEVTTQSKVNKALAELQDAIDGLQPAVAPDPDNLAASADITTSYCSSWENESAVNDGKTGSASLGSDCRHWGTWGNWDATEEWIGYEWASPVIIESSEIYFFDNSNGGDGGVQVPTSYTYEYQTADGEWEPIPTQEGLGIEQDKYNLTSFGAIETTGIRAILQKQPNVGGVGINEWKLNGTVRTTGEAADKEELLAAIRGAAEENYTEESWAAYEEVLAQAKKVLADAYATQEEVDQAVKDLAEAQKALVAAVKSLTVTAPAKTVYAFGEELDLAGMEVVAVYADGTTKTIDKDYEVSGYDAEKTGTQTITVTFEGVSATFEVLVEEKIVELPFEDVKEDEWYYNAVYYNYVIKTMTGKDDTHFAPNESLARAQFALILYRMNDTPDVEYKATFPDVADGIWYTDAILWAADTKVVTGYTDSGKFGPADLINREQMAVMMYRYANYKEYESDESADISGYADAGKVSAFAKDAMEWAVGNGIISGKNEGTILDPQGNATRAECATIIMRFIEKFEK